MICDVAVSALLILFTSQSTEQESGQFTTVIYPPSGNVLASYAVKKLGV